MADCVSTSSSPRIPPLGELSLSSPNLSPSSSAFHSFLDPDHPASPPSASPVVDPSAADFEFGEQVFHRRRAAWLAMGTRHVPVQPTEDASDVSSTGGSMTRLEALLDGPSGSDVGEQAWRSGLEGVHRGLLGGRRLVKRMKLGLVIKVLRAGWIRDGTWPASLPPVPPSPPYQTSDLPTPFDLPTPSSNDANPHGSLSGTTHQSPPSSIALPLPPASLAVPQTADLLSPGSATSTTTATATTPGTGTEDTTPDVEGVPPPPEHATDPLQPPRKVRADESEGEGTPT